MTFEKRDLYAQEKIRQREIKVSISRIQRP